MAAAAQPVILIAEDDDNDVFFLERALKQARVHNSLRRVRDGEQAIAYLRGDGPYADRREHPLPCLMLLDLKMPLKNGFEVLAWTRQQAHVKRLPIVILTSSKEEPDINHAYDAGANTYLVKPVNYEELLDTIRALQHFWLSLARLPDLNA